MEAMAMVMIVMVLGGYFLPSINAYMRGKKNKSAILTLNLFLGWTIVGWIGALIWSMTYEEPSPKV